MKKLFLFMVATALFGVFHISAQIQIDHQLQLTGTGTNGEITGVKAILNSNDAVNAVSVQKDTLKYQSVATTGAGSSGSPYAVTLAPAIVSPNTFTANTNLGMVVYFKAPAACAAGPVYVTVSGLGAQEIKKYGSTDLAASDIASGQVVAIQWDGTNFEMLSQLGQAPSSAGDPTLVYTTNGF